MCSWIRAARWPRAPLIALVALTVAVISASPRAAAPPGVLAGGGPGSDGAVSVDATDDTNARDGKITLREAIMIVNGTLSVSDLDVGECDNAGGMFSIGMCLPIDPVGAIYANRIVFNAATFPLNSPGVITLTSDLPPLSTGSDVILGSFTGVVVDGGAVQFNRDCVVITSDNNIVRGLEIQNCGNGILVDGGADNVIGGTVNDTLPAGVITNERNELTNNRQGIRIQGDAHDNIIIGNFIGNKGVAAPSGGADPVGFSNTTGVDVMDGASNNFIGGFGDALRNVISGNTTGVRISGEGATANIVRGNYIGTEFTGSVALPNGTGLLVSGASETVIGADDEDGSNLISGNIIGVELFQAEDTMIQGNTFGLNAVRDEPLPNGLAISVGGNSTGTIIGGAQDGTANVISGNDSTGISVNNQGTATLVMGNLIGVGPDGQTPMGNGTWGIRFSSNAHDNVVGGVGPGEGNIIAHNGDEGVQVDGEETYNNTVRGNSIHSNGLQGIGLQDGGNLELPTPVITSFGSVAGTACPDCTIDIYSDDEDEGRVYEGSTVADGAGNWTFPGTPSGPLVTATATDAGGNTSEFSTPADAGATPTPAPSTATPTPTPTPTGGPQADALWGDDDCNLALAATDALKKLQDIAAIDYEVEPGCPALGNTVNVQPAGFGDLIWGDTDCDGDYDAVDALQILRSIAALPANQTQPCPGVGSEVVIG